MKNKQYQGELNPKTAAEGIKLAYKNALSLLSDAELLAKFKLIMQLFD